MISRRHLLGLTASLTTAASAAKAFATRLPGINILPQAKAAAAAVKDLDSFKAQMGEVGKNCGGCHNTYRKKQS